MNNYDARFDHHSPEYDPSCMDDIEPDEEPEPIEEPLFGKAGQEFLDMIEDDDEEDINPQDDDIKRYYNEQSESEREDMENE